MRGLHYLGTIITVLTISIFSYGTANAQTTIKTKKPTVPEVTDSQADFKPYGSVTVSTDGRSQGFTSTDEKVQITGDIGFIYKQFYMGVSASNLDLGKTPHLVTGRSTEIGDYSIDYYIGHFGNFRGFNYSVGVNYSTIPDGYDPFGEFDYVEFNAGISKEIAHGWIGGARVYFSPKYSGDVGQNWVFEATAEKSLGTYRGMEFIYTSSLGYQEGDDDKGNFDYWFWNAGVEIQLNKMFSVDLRYHDTAEVPTSCKDVCDEAFTASLTMEF